MFVCFARLSVCLVLSVTTLAFGCMCWLELALTLGVELATLDTKLHALAMCRRAPAEHAAHCRLLLLFGGVEVSCRATSHRIARRTARRTGSTATAPPPLISKITFSRSRPRRRRRRDVGLGLFDLVD